jgi:hypothetical protein
MTNIVQIMEKPVIKITPFGICSWSHMIPQCPANRPPMKIPVTRNFAPVKYL